MRGLAPTLGENTRVCVFWCSTISCGNKPSRRAVACATMTK